MSRIKVIDPDTATVAVLDTLDLESWRANERAVLWIDFDDEDVQEQRRIMSDEFGIHELAIADAFRERHPPKFEKFDDFSFLLLKGLSADTSDIHFETIQIAIFAGERWIITKHPKESVSVDRVWNALDVNEDLQCGRPELLLIQIFNFVVRRFITILLGLENRLDELETEVFERPRDALLKELVTYKSNLKQLRRIANYHRQISMTLKSRPQWLAAEDLIHEITDIDEQLERSVSLSTLYHELASDLVNAFLAFSAHRLNNVMKILTVITAIFVPVTFVAGIYGMNFENMPELRSANGYFILLSILFVIIAVEVWFFRRKGWF